jgi:hypothetical protein
LRDFVESFFSRFDKNFRCLENDRYKGMLTTLTVLTEHGQGGQDGQATEHGKGNLP